MFEEAFFRGALVGLASAVHCSAMCGGIACGANLLLGAPAPGRRNLNLALMQVGRIATYSAIGAAAGTFGGGVMFRASANNAVVLQWAAAMSLFWMGLVLAGLMPRLAVVDSGMQALASGVNTLLAPLRQHRFLAPIALGAVWGLTACPMVYGAAFLSSLTRTSTGGATFMLGFGVGTVPAVIASAYGLMWLNKHASGTKLKLGAGLTLAAAGIAIAYVPPHFASLICAMN